MNKDDFKKMMGYRTDAELARYFGVNRQTAHMWKQIPAGYILTMYQTDKETFMRVMEERT